MQQPTKLRDQLLACMRLCQSLGESGQTVWELGKAYTTRKRNPYTQHQRLAYLKKAIAHLRRQAETSDRWRWLPVDIWTFVESPRLLNKMGAVWPEVMPYLEELNSGQYSECVLTGGIGVAKSTMALYTQIYQVYILSCMTAPHEEFELDPASEILIVIQSISQKVATDVDYKRMRSVVEGSPYFNEVFPFSRDRVSEMEFPRRIYIRPVAGHDTAAIGSNVIGGILDEVNFMAIVENSKQTSDNTEFDQAQQNYDSIAERRRSRFMNRGWVPGMLCLISSRKYPGQFTDKKEAERKKELEATGRTSIFLYDMVLWRLRPHRFTSGYFRIFVGDATRKPRLLADDQAVRESEAHLVMEIPNDYLPSFKNNMLESLRSIAGCSTQAMSPFMMNTDAIAKVFTLRDPDGRSRSILSREECDFVERKLAVRPRRFRNLDRPRFVHLDMSRKRDAFGFCCAHVSRFVPMLRSATPERMPLVEVDCTLRILAANGEEIPYERVRGLIYLLKELGLPITWISADEYQSTDMLQILQQRGYVTGRQSMDVDTKAYDVTRQCVYDGRLLAPPDQVAQTEMTRLEFVAKTNKIDHPQNFSKDVSDAIAGCVYGLTMRLETWRDFGVAVRDIPATVADKRPGFKAEDDYNARRRQVQGLERLADRVAEEADGADGGVLLRGAPRRLLDQVR